MLAATMTDNAWLAWLVGVGCGLIIAILWDVLTLSGLRYWKVRLEGVELQVEDEAYKVNRLKERVENLEKKAGPPLSYREIWPGRVTYRDMVRLVSRVEALEQRG